MEICGLNCHLKSLHFPYKSPSIFVQSTTVVFDFLLANKSTPSLMFPQLIKLIMSKEWPVCALGPFSCASLYEETLHTLLYVPHYVSINQWKTGWAFSHMLLLHMIHSLTHSLSTLSVVCTVNSSPSVCSYNQLWYTVQAPDSTLVSQKEYPSLVCAHGKQGTSLICNWNIILL